MALTYWNVAFVNFFKDIITTSISILCEVDEITSALAGLKLVRTGTIANGAKKCDFRFIKKRIDEQYCNERSAKNVA